MAELKERNYSIDALRGLSMLMIVSLHSISHGIVETTWWGGKFILPTISICYRSFGSFCQCLCADKWLFLGL